MKYVSLILLMICPLFASDAVDAAPTDPEPTASFSMRSAEEGELTIVFVRSAEEGHLAVLEFKLPPEKNTLVITPSVGNSEIDFSRWNSRMDHCDGLIEEVMFEDASMGGGRISSGGDLNIQIRNYDDFNGLLSAEGGVCITCSGKMNFCGTRVSWGSRARFMAAPESPSAIRMIELLPRKGVKRGVVWGNVDFGGQGLVMGASHAVGLPPAIERGFTALECNLRITIRTSAVSAEPVA